MKALALAALIGLVAVSALGCGSGQGPSLDEMRELPVLADGCPVGEEITRREVGRSPISTASVELTCGTNAKAADVLKRVEALVGPYKGKTPLAGPASLPVIGIGASSEMARSTGWQPQYASWQPGDVIIEARVLNGTEVPAEGEGWATVYEMTVRANVFAK